MKIFEDTPAVLSLGKLCDEHGYSYEWITGEKPHLILKRYSDTENIVPIGVLCLSTSSSSSLPSSTSMTTSRQEIDHLTSSSSSSTSPTTTVWSDSETRVREDLSGIDSYVNMLKGKNGETCWPSQPKIQNQIKTKTTIKNGATRCIPKNRNGCKNSEKISWMTEFLNAETHTPVLLMKHR